jgi:hypothetical protein
MFAACGGDDGDSSADGGTDGDASGVVADEESGDDGPLEVDNCTLLTNEEVTSLHDEPLTHSEDGPLGCGWLEKDGALAQFSIRAFRNESSAQEHATELAPSLTQQELDGVGDGAVALIAEGEANFIVATQGDLGVEMVLTFLEMEVGSENLERAQELAAVALDRLEETQ